MSSQGQLSRLKEIAQKEEVVDTVQAEQLNRSPRQVEQEYRDHFNTHLSLADTSDVEQQLLTNLAEQTGTLGIIAGKFAYGKTSTSISFWDNCENEGYIAVPPFIFSTLTDLLDATNGWLKHKLSGKYEHRIESLYDEYQQKGLEQLADQAVQEHDISPKKASEVLAGLNDSGRINEDVPAEVLVEYFLDATELVEDAGYEGLVVFADEVQQFFKKHPYSTAEEELRSLIWGFKPRNVSFGMMFSIPDEQLAVINERGADILDRVRENNLLLNLTSVYDRDFPKELWDHYARKYEFEEIKHEIIPEDTLIAIGQYATRDDLSRGPRTVIDAFGYAVTAYIEEDVQYTPLRFVDSYIENELRFTEPDQTVQSAVSEVMAAEVVQSPEHEWAVKLMAAFPEGVPSDIIETYGLSDAMEDLSSELHGTLLTFYADGYTLVELVKGDPDVTVSGEILRDFWREYQETDEDVADALTAFEEHVLPRLFPQRGRGQAKTGWTVQESKRLHRLTVESYCEGTFDPNYPHRVLYIRTSARKKELGKVTSENNLDTDADLKIGFYLDYTNSAQKGLNELESEDTYQFVLDTNESLMKGDLPERIRKLKDYMNPRSVTPVLMLALTDRIDREIDDGGDNMTLAEKQSLETLRDNLVTETIEVLFDDELRERAPESVNIRRLRDRMTEDLFRSVMGDRYPDYNTLYKGRSITKLVGEYISALGSNALELALTQKQGRRPAVVSKNDLSNAFNVKSHASLQNKLTDKYRDLVELEWDYGETTDEVRITFELHPLEEAILDQFESDEAGTSLSREVAKQMAIKKGYTDEEVEQAIRLLAARQFVDDEDGSLVRVETGINKEEIKNDLAQATATLEKLSGTAVKEDLNQQAAELTEELADTSPEDEETLEDIRERVTKLQRLVGEELESQFNNKKRELDELRDEAESLKRAAQKNQLEKIEVPVTFARHLNKQRNRTNNRYRHINSRAEELEERITKVLDDVGEATPEAYAELAETCSTEEDKLGKIQKEFEEQEEYREGYRQWRSLAAKADDLDERVLQFANRTGEREFQDRLDKLLEKIGTKFSEQGLDMLTKAQYFEDDLERIEEDFNDRVSKKREAFQNEKQALNSVLQEAADGHPGLRTQFSEANPDQSYELLEEDFKQEIRDTVIDDGSTQLEQLHRMINRAERFQALPEGIDIDQLCISVEETSAALDELAETVTQWSINDGTEAVAELSDDFTRIRDEIKELDEEVQTLNRPVRPDDETLVELYDKLEYGTTIQLDDVLEVADEDDPKTLATELAELFQRNLLDIQIEKRFRELPDE